MRDIRIVFFDAGHTLLHTVPSADVVYAEAAARYGLEVEPKEVGFAFREAFSVQKLDGRPQDKGWWRELVVRTFARFGTPTDMEALFEDLYRHFTSPDSWELFEGALPLIDELHARGYRTGLVSNWDDRLPGLLDGLDLTRRLDPIVVSYRVGVEKPHTKIFETALAEAGVAPEAALMVGDDYEADVLGARNVGMQAVQVFHDGQQAGDGRPTGDGPSIGRLDEILDLLPKRRLYP